MKKLVIITVVAAFFVSCGGGSGSSNSGNGSGSSPTQPSKPDCEINRYAWLIVSNSSSNPYDVYINNKYMGRMNGNSISNSFEIPSGNNIYWYAKQVSGYLLYPTECKKTTNVLSCSNYSWQIP